MGLCWGLDIVHPMRAPCPDEWTRWMRRSAASRSGTGWPRIANGRGRSSSRLPTSSSALHGSPIAGGPKGHQGTHDDSVIEMRRRML